MSLTVLSKQSCGIERKECEDDDLTQRNCALTSKNKIDCIVVSCAFGYKVSGDRCMTNEGCEPGWKKKD